MPSRRAMMLRVRWWPETLGSLVRAALAAGHAVSPIPGPSAPLAALAASGLPTDAFLYLGYLPRKGKERRELIAQIANLRYTLIFLEAPHRLLEALVDLQEGLGDRPISLGRELTKLHEEIWRGRLSAARVHFTEEPPRGEFTLVIGGKEAALGVAWTEDELHAAIREGLKSGEAASALAARLAAASGWTRREIYKLTVSLSPKN